MELNYLKSNSNQVKKLFYQNAQIAELKWRNLNIGLDAKIAKFYSPLLNLNLGKNQLCLNVLNVVKK